MKTEITFLIHRIRDPRSTIDRSTAFFHAFQQPQPPEQHPNHTQL